MQDQSSKTEYVLVSDMTGEPDKSKKVILFNGQEIKVPHLPKPNCKKCYGRGYLGTNAITHGLIFCNKCYRK